MNNLANAIRIKYGYYTSFSIDGDDYSTLTWSEDNEITKPSEQTLLDEVARIQAEFDDQEYARSRAEEYPSIGDQLDMIFHAGLGGDEFQAAIQAVKAAYPKPTQ